RHRALVSVPEELLRADEADELPLPVRDRHAVVAAPGDPLDRLADGGVLLEVLDLEDHVVLDPDRHPRPTAPGPRPGGRRSGCGRSAGGRPRCAASSSTAPPPGSRRAP